MSVIRFFKTPDFGKQQAAVKVLISTAMHAYLLQMRLFCKKATHNREAPTKHNALCGSRSAWEVIEQTSDFSGGR